MNRTVGICYIYFNNIFEKNCIFVIVIFMQTLAIRNKGLTVELT